MRTWSLIGAGAAGTAVAALLARRGDRIAAIWSRRIARAKAARALIGQGRVFAQAPDAARCAPWLLIAVPDGAIVDVALSLHRAGALSPGQTVIHLSGSLPASALKVRPGLRFGSLHPVQTLPTAEEGLVLLPGSFFGVEGSPAMLPELEGIARDLGGIPLRIPAAGKPLYHAALAMASNHLTALAAASAEMLVKAGLGRRQALPVLQPLMRGTLEALTRQGIPGALTGPVARGDAGTVRAHRAALRDAVPELLPLYNACARQVLRLARAKGLGAARAREIERVLRSP